jgi:hypothetical protein
MKRLTEAVRDKSTGKILAYKLKGFFRKRKAVTRLGQYEDAEEDDRLWHLPCRAGSTVYRIDPDAEESVIEMRVGSFVILYDRFNRKTTMLISLQETKCGSVRKNRFYKETDIGKQIFLSRREAAIKAEELKKGSAEYEAE